MMYYWFMIGEKNTDAKISFLLYHFKITYLFRNIILFFPKVYLPLTLHQYLENKSPRTKHWKMPHHN